MYYIVTLKSILLFLYGRLIVAYSSITLIDGLNSMLVIENFDSSFIIGYMHQSNHSLVIVDSKNEFNVGVVRFNNLIKYLKNLNTCYIFIL